MSDRITWVDHKGQKILFGNYSGSSEEEYCSTMDEMKNMLNSLSADTILLVMADVSNTHATGKVRDKGAEVSNAMGKFKGRAYAVVGVTGIMKVVAKTFVHSIHFVNNLDEAKDWLVEQAPKLAEKQAVAK